MIWLNENPLTPASLATGRDQGAEAKAYGPCGLQDNAQLMGSHYIVGVAVTAARAHLAAIAGSTDEPHPGLVEAAHLLDVVAERLQQAQKGVEGPGETEPLLRQRVT